MSRRAAERSTVRASELPTSATALSDVVNVATLGSSLTLALGGGAARAVCHVGVARAVKRAGLTVGAVSGTSAGALVAAMYARGQSDEAIENRFLNFSCTSLFRAIRWHYVAYLKRHKLDARRRSLYNETGLSYVSDSDLAAVPNELYHEFVAYFAGPDCNISDLQIPFAASAVDLASRVIVSFSTGRLHTAVQAACAVPGLFPPQAIGELVCVDASPAADLPVDAASQLNRRSPILGVLIEKASAQRSCFQTSQELFCRYVSILNAQLEREQLRRLDLLIRIPAPNCGLFGFDAALRVARTAEEHATRGLAELMPRIRTWSQCASRARAAS